MESQELQTSLETDKILTGSRLSKFSGAPVVAEIVFTERDYVNSNYRNYEEDNTVFCNVNIEPLW